VSEVGTVSQGYTIEEAVANLREATELYLEEFPTPRVSTPILTTFEAVLSGQRMPRLSRVSGEQAIRALEKIGFRRVRQRGSHVVLKRQTPQGEVGCVVPMHRELAIGTLHGILKQAGVTQEQFIENL